MKQFKLTFLLTVLMSIVEAKAYAYDAKIDGIYYNFSGTEAEVTTESYYFQVSSYSGDVVIPSTVTYEGQTFSVTSIGVGAFDGCTGLTSVEIPNSVTSIGDRAFIDCTGLTSVTIPSSVTSIGVGAFYGCIGLISITIPNSVTSIGVGAFGGTTWYNNQPDGLVYAGKVAYEYKGTMPSNTSITLEEGTLGIAGGAFDSCTGLTSVTIPNSVTTIGAGAFRYCSGLTSITIPNSVTTIGRFAFDGTAWYDNQPDGLVYVGKVAYEYKGTMPAYTSITLEEGTLGITDGAFDGCPGLTSIDIPNTVTTIGNSAFYGCSLTSITIPNSVTSIGGSAFSGCTGLTSATIGNSVTTIGYCAFSGCYRLTSIEIPNSVTTIGDGAFGGCIGLTSITIGNSVTSIGGSAFGGCIGLTSITIPNSVTKIDDYAFYGCTGLTSISVENGNPKYDSRNSCNAIIETATITLIQGCKNTIIPNSVTSIGVGAFGGCTDLTSITIPNSVTSIGADAFNGCTGLTSITIPNGVTSFGTGAFVSCTGLTFVVSFIEDPFDFGWSGMIFSDETYKNATLYVPEGTIGKYTATGGWRNFKVIKEVIKGDPNGDGLVNVTDIVATVNFIMEKPSEGFIKEAADLNGDGKVNVTDIVMMVSIIMDASAREMEE